MREPTPRASRLAIAGSLVALILVGGGGFLLGREAASPTLSPAASPDPASPAVMVVPELPPERILSRADLIELGNVAADAAASGTPLPARVEEFSGKRFEIRLPFGCNGPAQAGTDAPLSWRYDSESSTLRIHVAATSWPAADWWPAPPAGLEALEGFWLTRPWSTSESCPPDSAGAAPQGIEPVTLPGQTLGVAQIITEESPRQVGRSGEPYEAVVRVAPGSLPLETGLRLRLRGRVAGFPDGRSVRCVQPGGPEQRPVCLIAVAFDEVAIENPTTRSVLAAWNPTIAGPAVTTP